MREILSVMRQQAQQVAGERATTRYGIVSSYDPNNYSAKVILQPDGVNPTNWMPVLSPWIGNGWGMFCPPSVGDMVEVEFQEADHDVPMSCMRVFNDKNRPLPVPSGEFWLVHKNGAYLKLTNDGKLLINSQVEIDVSAPTINIQATGNVNVVAAGQANVTAPAINLGASGQSLLSFVTSAFQALFNGHTHKTNAVGSQTDPTLTPISSSHLTSTVKGG